jgi:hypothetical protein
LRNEATIDFKEDTHMSDLVQRLGTEQDVEVSMRPETTVEYFKAAVDRGYVHIKFIHTRGGTELGIRLDREASDFSQADWEGKSGKVTIVGNLILDYVKVRFHGTIDLSTLKGLGYLENLGEYKPWEEKAAAEAT